MLFHKKSGALFEETLVGDYYTLQGLNIEGTFRIATDFINDFEFIPNGEKVTKIKDRVEWNRSLIYYIGKDRAIQRKKKAELKQARLDRAHFKNITENIAIKDDVIQGLDLSHNIERIEKFDYERILPKNIKLNQTPKAMEERFSPAQYGRVLSYGIIIDTDYIYYLFENGVRVDLKKIKPDEPEEAIEDKKVVNDKTIKTKDKKSTVRASGPNKGIYDMVYLEKQLNLPATKIRSALRKHFEKPDGGWKWNSKEEIDKVIAKIKK